MLVQQRTRVSRHTILGSLCLQTFLWVSQTSFSFLKFLAMFVISHFWSSKLTSSCICILQMALTMPFSGSEMACSSWVSEQYQIVTRKYFLFPVLFAQLLVLHFNLHQPSFKLQGSVCVQSSLPSPTRRPNELFLPLYLCTAVLLGSLTEDIRCSITFIVTNRNTKPMKMFITVLLSFNEPNRI